MANQEHLAILKQGVETWNQWREEHPNVDVDLSYAHSDLINANLSGADLSGAHLNGADLSYANLSGANLSGANLSGANLSGAYLRHAILRHANFSNTSLSGAIFSGADLSETDLNDVNFSRVNLSGADLFKASLSRANLFKANLVGAYLIGASLNGADLSGADLRNASLTGAYLSGANLSGANLSRAYLKEAFLNDVNLSEAFLNEADLSRADLSRADLSRADLSRADLSWSNLSEARCDAANLTGCNIYAISAWNVHLEKTIQTGLIITRTLEPTITVDNLEVAQFIYLLLNNQKIRDVINTLTTKSVLILGRFTPERKAVLDALREALRQHNYLPILFDFEQPASRDITETISTLAHLARFVIADVTDAKSIPQELMLIVPNLPSVPVQPLILESQHEYGMFEHFMRFPWVLPIYRYTDEVNLLQSLQEKVITPAEQKAKELEKQ